MHKIAILFAGQGAQYPGMMKDIADQIVPAGDIFRQADEILNREISAMCFEGTQEELNLTHNTQPCVFSADLAAYAAVAERGIIPDAVAGFSLGEYAALTAAGSLDLANALPLVQLRADYMQEAVPVGAGSMAAVMKLTAQQIEALCGQVDGYVVPANYNCPGQTVVSGETGAVKRLHELAKAQKGRVVILPVSAPFHCRMMAPAAKKLSDALTPEMVRQPRLPVYMNVDAGIEADPGRIRDKLISQAMSPVRWEETLRNMRRDGIDTFIEVGPGKTLSGFVKKTFPDDEGIRVFNVSDLETLENTAAAIQQEM